ncbi:GNAT family N-acetyltransferase [Campylobacter sp. US33a]|uniref:GNAT family N-acetyltransferase n=1 Tax=Campylobacter sp. US33a TaxID=2498120 RepID=UPI001068AEE7|nr:GNAT family N-acetyltransferase [Campylobacter sp. US33a]TEY04622.1 GNAT family N-acetyltransferase [Campylobacter sp. US33a]
MIRKADIKDLEACIKLFKQSVKTLCAKDYTKDQIKAWLGIDEEKWKEKFKNDEIFIYEREGKIASFISIILDQKILDLLFTHPDFASQGLATNLLDFALRNYPHNEIYTFASLSAKEFFLKNDFEIVRENEAIRANQILKNFLMKKELK